jgi:uncharacterized protein (DUF488 family)
MGRLLTVGHGTLSAATFSGLVRGAGVDVVVDIRRFAGSRRHPHFGSEAMAEWLDADGTDYRWLPALGGRRRPSPASANTGLRNPQFRAYADHMSSGEFAAAVADLLHLQAGRVAAVMCSESVWWRCHRRLLADHLVLIEELFVEHLFHDGRLVPHPVTPEARPGAGRVAYGVVSHDEGARSKTTTT